ncbi:MAG: OmpA family protein [Desulfobacterales bacterium]
MEGEVTKIIYAAPEGLSVLQVQRNYQIALKEAGFEIVYECFGENLDEILEEKPMDTGNVKVDIDAEAMAEDIEEKGSVRVYGIRFDTDKATIREESESVLAEIAALLERESDLRFFVVGHTDAVGSKEYNMDLSEKRAEAVEAFLVSEHGISEDRLIPQGAGPLAPVASNEDEDGRAQNRRVELVKITDQ